MVRVHLCLAGLIRPHRLRRVVNVAGAWAAMGGKDLPVARRSCQLLGMKSETSANGIENSLSNFSVRPRPA